MSYRGGRITYELYLSARAERISLMEVSCVSQLIKVASFSLQPCKKSCWNVSYYRLLLMETEVTGCILPTAFLQKENITGCLCSVSQKGRGKYQLKFFILHFRQFDNCNIILYFQTVCSDCASAKLLARTTSSMTSICDQGSQPRWETIFIIYIAGALWSSCQKPSHGVMCCPIEVKMSLPWTFLT